MYALICVLRRHYVDLDSEQVQHLLRFIYPGYNVTDRRAEKERAEQAASEATGNGEDPLGIDISIQALVES